MNILEDFWYGNINPQEESKERNRGKRQICQRINNAGPEFNSGPA